MSRLCLFSYLLMSTSHDQGGEGGENLERQAAQRYGRLASLQLGLQLSEETAARVLRSAVRTTASMHFVAAAKFARVGESALTWDGMRC